MEVHLKTYWNDFLDLLFPRSCQACENALVGTEQTICTACRISLPRMDSDSASKTMLGTKFAAHPEVVGVFAYLAFTKKGKVQNLLHALKYKKQPEVGVLLGKMLAQEINEKGFFPTADLILSVPLHKKRMKERGYNQSDAFASGLSDATAIPWSGTTLVRTRYTKSQTGKTKLERRENVEGIFRVDPQADVKNLTIILVDDVLTTGATLDACVQALVAGGCTTLYIMTIAAAQQ